MERRRQGHSDICLSLACSPVRDSRGKDHRQHSAGHLPLTVHVRGYRSSVVQGRHQQSVVVYEQMHLWVPSTKILNKLWRVFWLQTFSELVLPCSPNKCLFRYCQWHFCPSFILWRLNVGYLISKETIWIKSHCGMILISYKFNRGQYFWKYK